MASLAPRPSIDIRVLHLTNALLDGIRRVAKAPTLVVGVYMVTLLTTIPLGIVIYDAIAVDLGNSVAADTAVSSVNWEWWEEFQSRSSGITRTFNPRILGFAAVLTNLSNFIDNRLPATGIVLAAGVYLGVWIFLVGGIIDRLARQRRTASAGFFAVCGIFFFRFIRLGLLAGIAYWILFGLVHHWLFDVVYVAATENLAVERSALLIQMALYVVFGLLLLPVNLVFDYAKIRAIVEDRHSMVGAVLAAFRFVRRHPKSTFGLYLLNSGLFLAIVVLYALVAPSPGTFGSSISLGFAVGQAYLVARLVLKLVFLSSQTAFFQNQLAHADYVAITTPVWPDSPAAEAIGLAQK